MIRSKDSFAKFLFEKKVTEMKYLKSLKKKKIDF